MTHEKWITLTPSEQISKVAELCGWESFPLSAGCPNYWKRGKDERINWRDLPDYINDLNAMHEAERVLTEEQSWQQSCLIVNYHVAPAGFPLFSRSEVLLLARATAAQRAEAFVLTLELEPEV
jgi:hypothetical protein